MSRTWATPSRQSGVCQLVSWCNVQCAAEGWRSPCFGRRMMNGSGLKQAIITDITKKLFLKLSALAWLCTVK